jgi:hypothetical protein
MIAFGILVAGASGLCSFLFLSPPGGVSGNATAEMMTTVLVVGGIPFAAGILLIFGGYLLIKRRTGED